MILPPSVYATGFCAVCVTKRGSAEAEPLSIWAISMPCGYGHIATGLPLL